MPVADQCAPPQIAGWAHRRSAIVLGWRSRDRTPYHFAFARCGRQFDAGGDHADAGCNAGHTGSDDQGEDGKEHDGRSGKAARRALKCSLIGAHLPEHEQAEVTRPAGQIKLLKANPRGRSAAMWQLEASAA